MPDIEPTDHPDPLLHRREFVGLIGATAAGLAFAGHLPRAAAAPGDPLAPVPAYDPTMLVRSQFLPDEQRYGRYLVTLADLANEMDTETVETYGRFTGGYWRPTQIPTNARVQESVYTLAWFYTQQRTWNPYRLNEALRDRLFAAIRYYLSLQFDDGSFPQYSPVDHNRTATTSALLHLGETLLLLDEVGWPADLRAEVVAALTRTADYVAASDNEDLWVLGTQYSNQMIFGLMGLWVLRDVLPARFQQSYEERLDFFVANAQSPATGYYYEGSAFDAHYSLYVTTRAAAYFRQLGADQRITDMQLKHFDWCSYNYLWEPDGAGFVVNGVSTRLSMRSLDAVRSTLDGCYPELLNLWAPDSPVAVGLNWHQEHVDTLRADWASGQTPIEPLTTADPVNMWSSNQPQQYASYEQRMAAIDTFPYRAQSSFAESLDDERHDQRFVFVRRRGYYFGSHHGDGNGSSVVPKGPSFFYHPTTGTFVATQMNTDSRWSTRLGGGFIDSNGRISKVSGELHPTQNFDYTYYAYRTSGGLVRKTFTCQYDKLVVSLETDDTSLIERVPLVIGPDDQVAWITAGGTRAVQNGMTVTDAVGVRITRPGGTFELRPQGPTSMTLGSTSIELFSTRTRVINNLDIAVSTAGLKYTLRITV